MKKIDSTIWKETIYILIFTSICSVFMEGIFILARKWDYTVLLGNLLGIVAASANFLLMGITVQIALSKEEKEAADMIKFSQIMRLVCLFGGALIAYFVPIFNIIAVVIPYLFPRFAIALRPLFIKHDQ